MEKQIESRQSTGKNLKDFAEGFTECLVSAVVPNRDLNPEGNIAYTTGAISSLVLAEAAIITTMLYSMYPVR